MEADKTTKDVNRRRGFVFLAIACVLAGMISLLLPADAPWICDEPLLLMHASNVVHGQETPVHGMVGNAGLYYGPVPFLIYAVALVFTQNLVLLVFLRALLFMLAMGVAIWWLARLCPRLSPPIGALALLSPYYWFYSRALWDNTFLIPFSALTLAAYVSFCRTRTAGRLWGVALGMVLMLQTHLMCLPLFAAIAGHFVWRHRSWARQHARHSLLIAVVGFIACLPYFVHEAQHLDELRVVNAQRTTAEWVFALMGGRTFSAVGLDYFYGDHWQSHSRFPVLLWILTGISALGLIGFWVGLGQAWRLVMKNRGLPGDKPIESQLFSVVLVMVALQLILNGVTRTSGHPHYYSGTSFGAFTLVWLAYSQIGNRRWRWTLAGMHALALLMVLLSIIWRIHEYQGNTNIHYGPTLRTQLDALKSLDSENPQSMVSLNEMLQYHYFPHAFYVLQMFYPLHFSTNAPVTRLLVRYADPQADSGRLVVVNVGQ